MAESSTMAGTQTATQPLPKVEFVIPSSFILGSLPAATLGLMIGMSRGGRRARLRHLAENSHRQPTTYQGWYFYMKTRNYKIMLDATKVGLKYAMGLGGCTLSYMFLEEYVAWAREEWFDDVLPRPAQTSERKEITWRRGGAKWSDGIIAGTTLGTAVGIFYRMPKGLFFRCLFVGSVLGAVRSGMITLQEKGLLAIQEEEAAAKATEVKTEQPLPVEPEVQQQQQQENALPVEHTQPAEPVQPSTWGRVKGWWGS